MCIGAALTYAALLGEAAMPMRPDGTKMTNYGLFTRRTIDEILHDASHADAPHRQASTSDVATAVRKREEQKLFAPSIFTLHRNSYLNTQQHERFCAMSKAMGVGLPGARRIPLSAPHSLSVLRALSAQLLGADIHIAQL